MSEIRGLEDFRRRLEAMNKKLRNKTIRDALRSGAKTMARAVAARAPVATGKLKKSVKVRAGKRKRDTISMQVVITGGHPTPMVAAAEYGTRDAPAQPFIRPGFEATKDEVAASALGQIKQGIEQAATQG